MILLILTPICDDQLGEPWSLAFTGVPVLSLTLGGSKARRGRQVSVIVIIIIILIVILTISIVIIIINDEDNNMANDDHHH